MAPFLPNETWTWVFHFSDKSTLKNTRAVSKRFARLIAPRLFNRLFIGPSAQTLDVFQKIISHQELSTCVQIMVFDASFFSKYSSREYERQFHSHCSKRARSATTRTGPAYTAVADVERSLVLRYGDDNVINRNMLINLRPTAGAPLSRMINILQAGFRKWESQRAEQDRYMKDMTMWLTAGFCMLPNLKSVEWQPEWACEYVRRNGESDLSLLPVFPSSGPLARSWCPLFTPPSRWVPEQEIKAVCHMLSSFAVSGAAQRDVSLSVQIPVSHLQSELAQENPVHQHWASVTQSLTSLTLKLATDEDAYFPGGIDLEPLHLLSACLQTANRLQILDITIDCICVGKRKLKMSYLCLSSLFGPSTPSSRSSKHSTYEVFGPLSMISSLSSRRSQVFSTWCSAPFVWRAL